MDLHEKLQVERERFTHNSVLQAEFHGNVDVYLAFVEAEQYGRFKVFSNAQGLTKHKLDMTRLDQDFGGTEVHLSQARCHGVTMTGRLERLSNTDGADFSILAYTGNPVNRAWGRLAIDVNGIQAKQSMPILLNHDPGKIVGYTLSAWRDGSFRVSGKFSDSTAAGRECKALSREGFPWQASIGVNPIEVLAVAGGKDHFVNNRGIVGPAEVWSKSEVLEVSFVPLGADSDTSIALLNFQERS